MYLFNNRRKYMPGGTIVKRSIATATVSLPNNSYTYTGEAITPTATVRLGDLLLVVNEDYTVTYTGNTDIGMATVTITGMGNFYGTATADFYITAAPTGWAFKVDDMEHVGSAMSGGGQNTALLCVCETYSNTAALLVGKAWLSGRHGFGNLITKDSQNKFHVANLSSSLEKASSGSGEYLHMMLVSADGKTTFWRSNDTVSNCVKATTSVAFDLTNLSFDTTNVISGSTLDDFSPPNAVTFADSGNRVFYANNARRVHSVLLSTPYDFSTFDATTKTYVEITEVTQSYTFAIHSILFNENGTRVLITANKKIYQFSLSTPYDLTTRTLESEASIDADFHGIAVVNNGTTLFGMTASGYVHEYDLMPA